MAERESFEGNQVHGGSDGCFLPLIFSDQIMTLDMDNSLTHYTNTSSLTTQNNNNNNNMLCFGNYSETVRTDDSSSCNDINNSKSNRRRNGSEPVNFPVVGDGAPAESSGRCRKRKTENPTSKTGHAKVRKEKVGERIIALQQLVSPYGKTDTASVLHEAKGYIKFLHDQVQVLCSPYLQRFPSDSSPRDQGIHDLLEGGEMKDLRSRGLCLVPLSCTVHVANTNGADFWSSATPKKSSCYSTVAKQ